MKMLHFVTQKSGFELQEWDTFKKYFKAISNKNFMLRDLRDWAQRRIVGNKYISSVT